MFSTDFIFRQQENLVDNQKCQAGFRPLCNKILLLNETIVDFQDPSSYFDQEFYRKQLQPIGYEDNTLQKLLCFWICVLMILMITVGILEMNEVNFITASPWDSEEKLSCVLQLCVQV